MKIFDLNEFQDYSDSEADVCIAGSGPAGLSIANEFAGANASILVLESGGLDDEPDSQALYDIESIGARRKLDQSTLRRRIFGGSSHVWTGRCAPFSEMILRSDLGFHIQGGPLLLTTSNRILSERQKS
jgi:choline dehydrogenase-like flavoprotein